MITGTSQEDMFGKVTGTNPPQMKITKLEEMTLDDMTFSEIKDKINSLIRNQNEMIERMEEKPRSCCDKCFESLGGGMTMLPLVRRCSNSDCECHSPHKLEVDKKCYKTDKMMVCYCGKCEQEDYPLPKDFPRKLEVKSEEETLSTAKLNIVNPETPEWKSELTARTSITPAIGKTENFEFDKELSEILMSTSFDNYNYSKLLIKLNLFISQLIDRERKEADKSLAIWIEDYVGVSSKAIFAYMTLGIIPHPFDAPSDSYDRNRCQILLQVRPEWVDRLNEIEKLNIEGTRNEKKVYPWNEQIPLIRKGLTDK